MSSLESASFGEEALEVSLVPLVPPGLRGLTRMSPMTLFRPRDKSLPKLDKKPLLLLLLPPPLRLSCRYACGGVEAVCSQDTRLYVTAQNRQFA